MNPGNLSNIDYFDSELLITNQEYAILHKFKKIGNSIIDMRSGLDYYKMWLGHYNRNRDSITAKSNVEDYIGLVVKSRIKFFNILDFLKKELKKILKNTYTNEIIEILIKFVFDSVDVKELSQIHKITIRGIGIRLETICTLLKKYWNIQ